MLMLLGKACLYSQCNINFNKLISQSGKRPNIQLNECSLVKVVIDSNYFDFNSFLSRSCACKKNN